MMSEMGNNSMRKLNEEESPSIYPPLTDFNTMKEKKNQKSKSSARVDDEKANRDSILSESDGNTSRVKNI
jgi:hypothetical protein